MSKTVAIIQARMDSKRLPQKAILTLANKPLIAHVIERSLRIKSVDEVVLATCNAAENQPLVEIGRDYDVKVFIGSAHNVLDRFYQAAKKYEADYIVRVTGDNPFLDPEYANQTILQMLQKKADLCSIINLPLGVAIEAFSFAALKQAFMFSSKQYEFEHVTPFVKRHPGLFYCEHFNVEYINPFDALRLTVDTQEDFELATQIYDALYPHTKLLTADIVGFLTKNRHLVSLNSHVYQRKMTESNE